MRKMSEICRSLYIDSAAPLDLKDKVLEKIKTAIITGENKMSSIKEYFKEEGRKEGIELGTAKGFKQGTEHGFKQGAEQKSEKVALNMLKNGESTEKITLYTGLSKEKIANIQKTFNEKTAILMGMLEIRSVFTKA